jgi:hypothetical protein
MAEKRQQTGLGWFYLGAALGAVLAAGAVVVATEVQHGRSVRRLRLRGRFGAAAGPEELAQEIDLVEGLSHVVSEGLNVMADAVARLSDTFNSARREAIRYGLESDGASGGYSGSTHGWYTGEDDDPSHSVHYPATEIPSSADDYDDQPQP